MVPFVIKTILAPTDLSDLSGAGVRYALELAEHEGAEVIVFHVDDHIPYPYLSAHGKESIEQFVQDRQKDLDKFLAEHFSPFLTKVTLRREADVGVAFEKIVAAAEKENVDLIVLSTHGRTGLAHALIGSTTEQVIRHSVCPVLSIRPKRNE